MKNLLKKKLSKVSKIIGKQKKQISEVLDKYQKIIVAFIKKSGKENYYHYEIGSACYRAVKFHTDNKIVIGKVYEAKNTLGDYDRKIPFIRRNVQKALAGIFNLRLVSVKTLGTKGKQAQKFVSYKFEKIGK